MADLFFVSHQLLECSFSSVTLFKVDLLMEVMELGA